MKSSTSIRELLLRSDVPMKQAERITYAALRIVTGALFATHGAQKVLGLFAPRVRPEFGTQLWLGGLIELVGGILIAVGLFTRPVAFLASGTMAVAYFQFHFKFEFADWKWIPAVNQGELAVIYCFLLLFIAAKGSGILSVDHRWRGGAG